MAPSKAAQNFIQSERNFAVRDSLKYTKDEVFEASCIYAKQLLSKSPSKFLHTKGDLPKMNRSDLELGRVLGRGTFGVVQEVVGVLNGKGKDSSKKTRKTKLAPDDSDEDVQLLNKNDLSENLFRRNGCARFAIKYLSNDIIGDYNLCYRAILDMTSDCHFLSTLSHPSILKIRAIGACGPFDQNHFILLDRLHETLDKKLVSWRKNKIGIPIDRKRKLRKRLVERLKIACDLISAMTYLHDLHIIHRDLKPENIGFGYNSQLKLFDFGLAKDVTDMEQTENGLFLLTGNTGTCRYMAPEVAQFRPYNHSVDIYSFSILLWQLLSLGKPYDNYTYNMHQRYVVVEGHRPKIDDSWPGAIGKLLKTCWSANIPDRPSAAMVLEVLIDELKQISDA